MRGVDSKLASDWLFRTWALAYYVKQQQVNYWVVGYRCLWKTHLSSTLSFLSVSSLRLWMSSSGFNEVYGSCLQTFSGSYLYPSLCGRHLEWEKRVCHSQTVTFSFLIQKQDSLVIWLTVRVMSFGLGLCHWSERTIYLWMCLFSFLSYFLFWCLFLRVGHGCISSCGGRPWCAESQEEQYLKWNLKCLCYTPVKQKDGQSHF